MSSRRRPLTIARWAKGRTQAPYAQPVFMLDSDLLPARLSNVSVVLESGGLAQARIRLAAGARRVLFADALLHDISLMRSAIAEFGAERVGVWLPARRASVSWALDTQSNGDFKCMAPSNPQARWEVLTSDMRHVGPEAGAWVEQLVRLGVGTILISVDMQDDRDLDLCAGLVERFGERLWFSPLTDLEADLAPWVEFGQVSGLVLPDVATAGATAERLTERFGSARAARDWAA